MVVLKKIKASTLMETLVATVLIVVLFMMTSMILNNLFFNSIKSNTRDIDAYLNELEYLYRHQKIQHPYKDDLNTWEITLQKTANTTKSISLEAINKETNKTILRQIIEN